MLSAFLIYAYHICRIIENYYHSLYNTDKYTYKKIYKEKVHADILE